MRFSVLQISDLHRDLAYEVHNGALVDSLERDIGQWRAATPDALAPSVCIVTGDLVYGVAANHRQPAEELARQYDQAGGLLIEMADRFFGGDRTRLVILPGNHDVNYAEAMQACQRIEVPAERDARTALVEELRSPNSRLRWSFADFCFYRIVDIGRYERRFEAFQRMYREFYRDMRRFPEAPSEQFAVFDFPDIQLSVAALNSCYNNDPLRRTAAVHPDALRGACRAIRDPTRAGWVAAAAWHHSVAGPASDVDYLDSEVLQYMIDAGFSLGFHGHQHFPDCLDERYRFGTGAKKITVVSAGTLCGGPRVLAPGEPRSYNILEIDTDNGTGSLHKRQMVNHEFALPLWGAGHFVSSGTSHVEFQLQAPDQRRPAALDHRLALERADGMIGNGQWREAVQLLGELQNDPHGRRLLAKALVELEDPQAIIAFLNPPQSTAEAVIVGDSLLEAGERAEIQAFLRLPQVVDLKDASVVDVCRRLEARLAR